MWHLWIVVLIFTTDLSFSAATVYGSVNESPEDVRHGSGPSPGFRPLPSQTLDFIDTRPPVGTSRERTIDPPRKDQDVFSQLKHLQHSPRSDHRLSPFAASDSEMAGVRKSLATVLKVLLPYGRVQQRPHPAMEDANGSFEAESFLGDPLASNGPDTANYVLHGNLVQLGPRERGASASLNQDDDANRNVGTQDDTFGTVGQKRAAALRSTVARRSHILPSVPAGSGGDGEEGSFMPSISVGALTNLGDFFQNLKHNLESLESKHLNNDQVKLLEGQNMISNLRKEFVEDYPKPAGSAAFLHAIRNYRPSHRIRALVSTVPELYRGTNYHDPVYMLAGLGK